MSPSPLLRLARALDRLTAAAGRIAFVLLAAMTLIGALNAVLRYVGRPLGVSLSSNALFDAQWMLFGLVFLLGAAWTLQQDRHVRVDVLFGRLRPRTRAWIDLLGAVAFLLPFCALMLWATWPMVENAWITREGALDPGGLSRWPIKMLIPLGFVLLGLQGLSEAIKAAHRLRGSSETLPSSSDG
ncbi:MAG: TRAP transporter small permease subunit [Bacteroidota bacterium]